MKVELLHIVGCPNTDVAEANARAALDALGFRAVPVELVTIRTDLAPVCVAAGRAVTLGLILTELIINAQKYAYDGQPGPLTITLTEADDHLRLTVADEGKGGGAELDLGFHGVGLRLTGRPTGGSG